MPVNSLTIEQLTEARCVVLDNAKTLLEDALLLLNGKRYSRCYALSVLAREEMAKLAVVVRAVYALKAGEIVDWVRFRKRLMDHSAKLTLSALILILLSNSQTGVKDPAANLLQLLESPDNRKELNEGKQDGFYVGVSPTGIKDPRVEISEDAARELYLSSRALLEFFATGERTASETSSFAGISDPYGKYICLADDLIEIPDQVRLPR